MRCDGPSRRFALLRGSRAHGAALLGVGCVLALQACDGPAPQQATGFKQIDPGGGAHAASAPPPPAPSLWETPLEDAALERGRVVWRGTCIDCHATGLGGAPLIGNRELWAPRIAKGKPVLFEHALRGFYGKVGEMPARGGNAELSDEQVVAAVQFMISRVDAAP